MIINSLHKLKYKTFKEVLIEGKMNLLVTDGEHSDFELVSTWEDLLTQYGDLLGGSGDIQYYSVYRDFLYYKGKYDKVLILFEALSKIYVAEWFVELCEIVRLKVPEIDPTDKTIYNQTLLKCKNRANGIKLQLTITEATLIPMMQQRQKRDDNELPSYESFEALELSIDDIKNRNIDYENISTYKFCELVNSIKKRKK